MESGKPLASFSGHGFEGLPAIGPRQQLVDVAIWMSVDDPRQGVREISKRIDVVDLAGLD